MSRNIQLSELRTHTVSNQPPPLTDLNLFDSDRALSEALVREGGAWARDRVSQFGARVGSEEVMTWGEQANRCPPELHIFDRFGYRIDEVRFHPAYHNLMALGMAHGVSSIAWTASEPGGHVVHTALEFLLMQAEAGVCCPLTMTYAGIAALRKLPALAEIWEPRFTSTTYDPAFAPADQKQGATMGMAMTEKQGGSDVRANTTRATALGRHGPGEEYHLTGHKWFCSAPMCDAFLTLAYTDEGLSCFFVPRWLPDGEKNRIFIQRLKDKLGNKANASSEIEYDQTWAVMVGEPGRGVATIMDMVHHTRLDCTMGAAGLMRQAVVQALHHARHRTAFQRKLIDQPLMANVLADLALESEAATTLLMRVARSFDEAVESQEARAFARLAVALSKYWINKRVTGVTYEAMECLGGSGYVEESIMPRIYREAPLNSIWEGSGNVICLDVLRTLNKEPEALDLLIAEIREARGIRPALDREIAWLEDSAGTPPPEGDLRRFIERVAVLFQASLLVRHAPSCVSDAFCASRLEQDWGYVYGTLPASADLRAIIERASPEGGGA